MPEYCAMRRARGEAKMRAPLGCAVGVDSAGACPVAPPFRGGNWAGVSFAGAGFALASGTRASRIAFIAEGISPDGAASALSPSPSSTAMGVFTFTASAPSGTSNFPTRPSSMASNSIVALSVSISARISPVLTVSPSLTCHFASFPSSMVGESAGMRIWVDTSDAPRQHALGHVALPVLSVEGLHAHGENTRLVETARVHAVAVGMRARHIEGFDAAYRTEHVLRGPGVELIRSERLFALKEPEAILRDDQMQEAALRADRAIALKNVQIVRCEDLKGNGPAVAAALFPIQCVGVRHRSHAR